MGIAPLPNSSDHAYDNDTTELFFRLYVFLCFGGYMR